MLPEIIIPRLHGWDDEKVYFGGEDDHDHCVSDEPELLAKLTAICRDYFKKKLKTQSARRARRGKT